MKPELPLPDKCVDTGEGVGGCLSGDHDRVGLDLIGTWRGSMDEGCDRIEVKMHREIRLSKSL